MCNTNYYRYTSTFTPRIDVSEDDKKIYFDAELAGVDKNDVKVSIDGENVLTIKGEKKNPTRESKKMDFCGERLYGSFSRSFKLPNVAYTGKIEARFDSGILHVAIDKSEEENKEREVNIN
jgi:HSP20 family protein